MTPDEEMYQFASEHYGLIHRRILSRLGFSDKQIQARVRKALLTPLAPSVFRLGGAPPSPEQELLAATWAVPGVASHLSAAWLLGLSDRPRRPHVTTPYWNHPACTEIVVHRTKTMPSTDTSVLGIRSTNATRTLLDLASVVSRSELERHLDRALRLKLTTIQRLIRLQSEIGGPGRRGSALARDVITDLQSELGRLESDLESLLLRLIEDAGLPEPEVQYPVSAGGRRYRADLCYPQYRLIIEADGFDAHGGRQAFENDRRRQNDLVTAGWTVLRFTWRQICNEPGWVAQQIRAALG